MTSVGGMFVGSFVTFGFRFESAGLYRSLVLLRLVVGARLCICCRLSFCLCLAFVGCFCVGCRFELAFCGIGLVVGFSLRVVRFVPGVGFYFVFTSFSVGRYVSLLLAVALWLLIWVHRFVPAVKSVSLFGCGFVHLTAGSFVSLFDCWFICSSLLCLFVHMIVGLFI